MRIILYFKLVILWDILEENYSKSICLRLLLNGNKRRDKVRLRNKNIYVQYYMYVHKHTHMKNWCIYQIFGDYINSTLGTPQRSGSPLETPITTEDGFITNVDDLSKTSESGLPIGTEDNYRS